MRRRTTGTTVLTILAAVAAVLTMAVPGQAAPRGNHPTHGPGAFRHGRYAPMRGRSVKADCASAARHALACDARYLAAQSSGKTGPQAMTAATGFGPADIQSAYQLGSLDAGGRTVAIVDSGDDPKVEADLATYRSNFGLPACTTANGCFKKLNQSGVAGSYPKADYGWALETSLDVDMVSAACPTCHIVLVESNSSSLADMSAAEDTAAAQPGVVVVSNSFGDPADSADDATYNQHFVHAGVTTVASTGDTGNVVNWPSSMPSVTAAGGTSLKKDSNARGWSETAWSGAGSGCSKTQAATGFQPQVGSCTMRETADSSAVADPNTGVAVYDTASSCSGNILCGLLLSLGLAKGANGWVQVGGTSAASPIIASVYALAGDGASNAKLYNAPAGSLNDVTSGSDGSCGNALCTAGPGYDGPTGMGTPNGVGAF